MSVPKLKSYTANVKLNAVVSFNLRAESLEDATAKAREELKGIKLIADGIEYCDGTEKIIGISSDEWVD